MKKFLALMLTLAILATLCACSQAQKTSSQKEEITASEKTASRAPTESAADIRPELKEMLDSYETFFEEYAAFMKKYNENPTDTALLTQYSDFLTKYTDFTNKLSEVDQSTLSQAELSYYMEVTSKVQKLLADIGA